MRTANRTRRDLSEAVAWNAGVARGDLVEHLERVSWPSDDLDAKSY
jgi:hypothetical protein